MITSEFGTTRDGQSVKLFTLRNSNGLEARIAEYGATLVSLKTPDRDGKMADIVLGFENLADIESNASYRGATCGRFGNRIANGKFTLDGKEYTLATNNDPAGIPCHLHGGLKGFDKVVWKGEAIADGVRFSYFSKDGEEGYPGNLKILVTYRLTEDGELIFLVEATSDAPTPMNIVHHTYWNLSGDRRSSILDHELQLHADGYLPINSGMIPTGEVAPVKGTPMDFTEVSVIGERIEHDFEALKFGAGYDHCWVLSEEEGVRSAAKIHDPKSGRVMEIFTDQPGVQFYAGNYLEEKRTGLALETEGFPDAPNQPNFPNSILRPGEKYTHTLVCRFSAE